MVRDSTSSKRRTWSIDRITQSWSSSFLMTSLAIWSDGTCVTGFVFNFCADFGNCETRSVGIYSGVQTKLLNINSGGTLRTIITSIKSYVDDAVYALEICVHKNDCVMAGSAINEMNTNLYESSMDLIAAFWGSFSQNSGGQRNCLKDFGIDYLFHH